MSIDRILFKDRFSIDKIHPWICPMCNSGVLKADKKSIKVYESSQSKSAHSHPAWEPDWIYGGLFGFLTCSNSDCSEIVSIIGRMSSINGQYYNEEFDRFELDRFEVLEPIQFYPTINIFKINKDVPEKIAGIIINAFNLYWIDLSSCANKIRTVAEYIMDNKKIPKTYKDKKGKRKTHVLHQRIELFRKTNSEEADLLMAIKWIGNSGSHQIDNLTKDDVLDGFEILELVTTKLYETDSTRIKKLCRNINKKKKPIGIYKK